MAAQRNQTCPVAMTIAGSDSGGGAGIQADLKTFASLDVFGVSAITCITAQNPREVSGVEAVSPGMVARQMRTVCDAFSIAAAKTGMLFSAEIIGAVAEVLQEELFPVLVVDPVMVATSGARLLREDAMAALREQLLPHATVLTPNLPEAEILVGRALPCLEVVRDAAVELGDRYGAACIVKGGHAEAAGSELVDVLYDGDAVHEFRARRIADAETHGTGCTFGAAVTAGLALGKPIGDAVTLAQRYVGDALEQAVSAGDIRVMNWRMPRPA